MLLCDRSAIVDLLHLGYVQACEEQNVGIVERSIKAVSQEIVDTLAYRYPQPWEAVPDLLRYIAAVISAYRIVGAITTLVDSEGSTDNEWLPLQRQWKYCTDMLAKIASGSLKLTLAEAHPDREEPSFAVVSRQPFFDLRGL